MSIQINRIVYQDRKFDKIEIYALIYDAVILDTYSIILLL